MIPDSYGDLSWSIAGWLLAAFGYLWVMRGVRCQTMNSAVPWLPLLIASVALIVLWHIRAGTLPGLSLHLLGAMLCTLVFGPVLAVVPLTLALVSVTLTTPTDWTLFGLNACLLIFWPILISKLLAHLVSKLPSNIFVFIFVGGFFSSAGVVLLTGWLITAILWLMQIYPWGGMLEDFASYWLLVAFSEAWLTGMLLTVMVVYRPELVAMFDATRYIDQA
jgi:uncharacterized membrane protein